MALRNLPKTNPALYKELSQDIEDTSMPVAPTLDVPEEPAFADILDDSSDVPIAVVKSIIVSASQTIPAGFGTRDDGSIRSLAAVEDTDFDQEEDDTRDPARPVVTPIMGCGHRTKRRRRLFGDEPNWE